MPVSPEHVANECFMNAAVMSSMAGVHLKQGGPFGASIVRNGVLISCAHNTFSDRDPTCHGEMNALRLAMRCLGTSDLSDCVIYSSFDPCPMCWGATLKSGIKKVYMGLDRYEAAKGGVDYLSFYDALLNPKNNDMINVNPSATDADNSVIKLLNNNSSEHCIIVDKDYNVIADSDSPSIGRFCDPVDTPMVKAIRMACESIGSPYLNGCKVFTRTEPDVESYAACLWAFADSLFYCKDAPEGTRARYQHDQYKLEESRRDLQDSELLKEHPQLKAC
ncbi:hypothetical protein FOL47_002449 [Perkinsus chesapeaki]|uniref:CMP/dCMP-type deaminase domain-containing protein n=1 Tax=Perkinsus chesapeaki TaxID=330153 RepID=A0A7J6MDG1_PERCH|nr:hypothetical protein FOL47_002449 [Perkinsus chesapeaki]